MQRSDKVDGVIAPLFLDKPFSKDHIAEEVLTYWESLRQGRLVPKRSEIDPRKLRNSLDNTFILEAGGPYYIRFRLAGSELCDCMGMEMRGMPAYSMFDQAERNDFNEVLETSLSNPTILDFKLSPTARMLLLPMADDDNATTRILGCISSEQNMASFQTRFSIRSVIKTQIELAETIKPRVMMEMAETQTPFTRPVSKQVTAPPATSHLRVVK